MADENNPKVWPDEDGESQLFSAAPQTQQQPAQRQSTPYVRQRPAHRTVEPIDDFAQGEPSNDSFAHDSDFTTRGNVISGHSYRSSRRDSNQLRRDLRYGQYLEVPKGRRDIFVSREKRTRNRTIVALIVVIIVLAIAFYVVWDVLSGTWFAIG